MSFPSCLLFAALVIDPMPEYPPLSDVDRLPSAKVIADWEKRLRDLDAQAAAMVRHDPRLIKHFDRTLYDPQFQWFMHLMASARNDRRDTRARRWALDELRRLYPACYRSSRWSSVIPPWFEYAQ